MLLPLHKIYAGIVAILLSIVSVITFGYVKKREGAKEAKLNQTLDDIKKREEGKKTIYKEKVVTKDLSDKELLERLLKRTEDWSNL